MRFSKNLYRNQHALLDNNCVWYPQAMSYFVVFALPNYKNFKFMEQINGLSSL